MPRRTSMKLIHNVRMWGWILLAIIVVLVIYFLYFYERPKYTVNVGPFNLEKRPEIGTTTESQMILSKTNTGTFQAFVYPLPIQRTGQFTLCSTTGANKKPGEPDCATGRYGMCVCQANDCSPCNHPGYVNVLNLSNVVRIELLAAPDASRQKAATAQLVVRTKRRKHDNPNMETVEETMVLPDIPFQKWTMITVAREGRRFDIYYNAALVFSKRTQHMVDMGAVNGSIIAGDPLLNGKIAYVETFPEKLTATQISAKYSTNADTNGAPYLTDTKLPFDIPICKDGSCVRGPNVRPSSPLQDWDTQYA